MVAPVRGARIVLSDPSGVRANMPASWLAQMAWDVYVIDDIKASDLTEKGAWIAPLPAAPKIQTVDAKTAAGWLQNGKDTVCVDLSTHANYVKGHIPGSWFALRSQFSRALRQAALFQFSCMTSSPMLSLQFAPMETYPST